MPILHVELVGPAPKAGLARRIADAAGEVFGTPAGQTWVRLRRVPLSDWGENGAALPKGVRPVLVSVLKREVPTGAALTTEMAALAQAVGKACGRPFQNVHVLYEPAAGGRIAFGGTWVPRKRREG
jgi:phenylpyruvate tautomerase PptA (4-oxalocrotonate tautomerase family)